MGGLDPTAEEIGVVDQPYHNASTYINVERPSRSLRSSLGCHRSAPRGEPPASGCSSEPVGFLHWPVQAVDDIFLRHFIGLIRCKTCNRALTGQYSKGGQYPHYVCQSLIKLGKGACKTPLLNARRLEELIVGRIRSSILTDGNIGDLTKVVAQEVDRLAQEQHRRLETIESELADVRRRLGRLWDLVEITDDDLADTANRIKANSERQGHLEASATEATTILSQRGAVKDDAEDIAARAQDISEFLKESELPERRSFIETFVKEVVVMPGKAVIRYSVPMPDDSHTPESEAEEVHLGGSVTTTADSVR